MKYRIAYEQLHQLTPRREVIVEAVDESAAYDGALERMGEEERLIEVAPAEE